MAQDLDAEFRKFDTDRNGSIDEDEFGALVRSLGVQMTPEKIAVAFMAIDVDGSRSISVGEFKAWWGKRGG